MPFTNCGLVTPYTDTYLCQRTQPETKWSPFFQVITRNESYYILMTIFTNKPSTGQDNCLPPNMGQPMIWKSASLICWSIYASLGLRELDENPVKISASKTNTPQFFTVSNEQPLSINNFAFENRSIVCFVLKESILIGSVMLLTTAWKCRRHDLTQLIH